MGLPCMVPIRLESVQGLMRSDSDKRSLHKSLLDPEESGRALSLPFTEDE